MNRNLVLTVCGLMLLTSCETYTGAGAYTGSQLGAILGSAIGGLSDGPRGSDLGTIIGMAGGAAVGAVVGSAADQRAHDEMDAHRAAVRQRREQANSQQNYGNNSTDTADGSGFDSSNSGDDRIYDFNGSDYTGDFSAQQPTENMPLNSSVENIASGYTYQPDIDVVNARFIDGNQDGKIERGEMCKVIFEVMNRGNKTLEDVVPTVVEANGNRHIYISPSMHVERIAPGKGIRYTALLKADNRLKPGTAKICVSVIQGGQQISKVTEFNIPTVK